jgi:hypothetical protein
MRNVKGFLSDDGVFFDAVEDAELYEATHALEAVVANIGANPEKFLVVVDGCRKQLERYLNAKSKYEASEARSWSTDATRPGAPASPVVDNADDCRAEDHAPVLEQQADELEHVPDVGSSVRTEAVPDDSPINGPRGGGAHARSVRRAAHMATASPAAISVARGSGR